MGSDDSVVVTAPSVEEAIIVGLTRLVATRDEVDIEVLDEGSRGFLGIGAREARVRLVRSPHTAVVPGVSATPGVGAGVPRLVEAAPSTLLPVAETVAAPGVRPATMRPRTDEMPRPESPRHSPSPTLPPQTEGGSQRRSGQAAAYEESRRPVQSSMNRAETGADPNLDRAGLTRLAEEMMANMLLGLEIEATVEWVDEDRPTLWISLTGRDADALVGPRARNLHALQYLVRALLYHQSDGNYNVVVDADGYRKRQRRSLETMARAKADQAVAEGHMVRLRAMPPHERRIVHIILREDDRVNTESVGKGRDRAVTIVPRSASEPK